ncbi:MAG: biotin transporter BioY [Clostridia bacterium]|nr:biotin transporter BioY [Clostridia bacterium]
MKLKTKEINYVAISAAIIVVCSWICLPGAVPYTLQTFGVFFVAGLFGAKKSVLSVLIYILLGVVGLPVFAGGRGGLGTIMSESGGYIMAFLPAAYLCGKVCEKNPKSNTKQFFGMLLGLGVCYALGTLWAYAVYLKGVGAAGLLIMLSRFVLPFVLPDIAKIILAQVLAKKLRKTI